MRVLKRREAPDAGVSAVYVAISLFMIFGAAAVAVDAGSMYETKRNLVADTDSAALAAAKTLSDSPCSTVGTWSSLSAGNAGYDAAAELLAANKGVTFETARMQVERWCAGGVTSKVRVGYDDDATMVFAAVFGFNSLTVHGSSTAGATPAGLLRPIGVCEDDPDLKAAIAGTGTEVPGRPNSFRLWLAQEWNEAQAVNECGGSAGNWSYVCFDNHLPEGNVCQGNNAEIDLDLEALIRFGYPSDIDLGSSSDPLVDDEDCHIDDGLDGYSNDDPGLASPHDPQSASWCDIATGQHSNVFPPPPKSAFSTIQCDYSIAADACPERFPILIVTGSIGTGSSALMNPWAFLGVVLRDAGQAKPAPTEPQDKYIEFEVTGLFSTGSIQDTGLIEKVVRLCGVDHDPAGDRCGF